MYLEKALLPTSNMPNVVLKVECSISSLQPGPANLRPQTPANLDPKPLLT